MDNYKIDISLKDKLLTLLLDEIPLESVITLDKQSISNILAFLSVDFKTLHALLLYFERLGFISELNARPIGIVLMPHIEALDFKNRGGFEMQENIFFNNLELLIAEIQHLKPSFADRFENITTIIASLTTFLSFLKSR